MLCESKPLVCKLAKDLKLSVTCFSCMQAYFAIAEGLKQDADLKAATAKEVEELVSNIDPCMTVAHVTLKRKLEECGVCDSALQDQLESIVSSDAPLKQRLQDTHAILFPWVPQLVDKMSPTLQAIYHGRIEDLLYGSSENVGEHDTSDQ